MLDKGTLLLNIPDFLNIQCSKRLGNESCPLLYPPLSLCVDQIKCYHPWYITQVKTCFTLRYDIDAFFPCRWCRVAQLNPRIGLLDKLLSVSDNSTIKDAGLDNNGQEFSLIFTE